MGLIETLSKEYPVPYKRTRDMSESEYMKLVDRNTDLLDENKTLKEEIERLNNKLKDIKLQLDYLETYSSKEDVFEDMKRRLDRIDKIIGSDKE